MSQNSYSPFIFFGKDRLPGTLYVIIYSFECLTVQYLNTKVENQWKMPHFYILFHVNHFWSLQWEKLIGWFWLYIFFVQKMRPPPRYEGMKYDKQLSIIILLCKSKHKRKFRSCFNCCLNCCLISLVKNNWVCLYS